MGDFGEREPSFQNPGLRFFDPAVREVAMRCHPGRRLEGAGEMERTQTGLFRQRLDGEVFGEVRLDQILYPLETPGVERAAGNRQRYRGGLQVGMVSQDVSAKRGGQGLHQHLSRRCGIEHLGLNVPRDLLDQRIAKPAVIAQVDSAGIDIDFAKGGFRQRQGRKEEVDAFADLSVEMDHVLVNAGRAYPDRAQDRVAMLDLAVAAPPDGQAALKQDDDFRVADLDCAETAFRIPPAFRQ